MEPQKTIIVCSRHALLVAGFKALVAEPGDLIVSICSDPEQLAPYLARLHLSGEPPDLILIDVSSGITLHFLSELKSFAPNAGIILWIDGISPEFIRHAISSGVLGVLPRDASIDLSMQCISRVSAGQLWLDSEMSQRLLCTRAVKLSPRERQLVTLLTQGLRNKEIAWRMKITEGTAKAYLSRLFQKTGAADRFELAVFVLTNLEIDPSTCAPQSGPVFSFFPTPVC